MSKARQKGTLLETATVTYLRANGFKRASRPALTGAGDVGDVVGIMRTNTREEGALVDTHFIIQNKNQKAFALSSWLNDAVKQAENRAKTDPGSDAIGAVVFKRPGVGEKSFGEQYVLMRLSDLTKLLHQAQYT